MGAARQAYCFYFYVRIAYTLNTGIYWYSVAVLVFEFMASSSMVVHGLGLLRVRDHRGRAAVRVTDVFTQSAFAAASPLKTSAKRL